MGKLRTSLSILYLATAARYHHGLGRAGTILFQNLVVFEA